ncbi:hypothetical protein ACWCPC_30000, partial [Streptomyces decoyicus]
FRSVWDAREVDGGVQLHRVSPDGEEGFPGAARSPSSASGAALPGQGRTAPDAVTLGRAAAAASLPGPDVDDQMAKSVGQTLTPKSCAMPRRPEA